MAGMLDCKAFRLFYSYSGVETGRKTLINNGTDIGGAYIYLQIIAQRKKDIDQYDKMK